MQIKKKKERNNSKNISGKNSYLREKKPLNKQADPIPKLRVDTLLSLYFIYY